MSLHTNDVHSHNLSLKSRRAVTGCVLFLCSKHARFYDVGELAEKQVGVEEAVVEINGEPTLRKRVTVDDNPHLLVITGKSSPHLSVTAAGKGGQLKVSIPPGPVIRELAKRAGVSTYGQARVTAFAVDRRNSRGEPTIAFRMYGKAVSLTLEEIKNMQGTFRMVVEAGYITSKKGESMWALKAVEGLYEPELSEIETELVFFDEFYEAM